MIRLEYILKAEPTELTGESDVEHEKKRGVRDDSNILGLNN